jgi:transposase
LAAIARDFAVRYSTVNRAVKAKGVFTQIVLRAYALGVLRVGDVSLDGTKMHAQASKHKALYRHPAYDV